MSMEEIIRERDEALLSLDEERLRRYFSRYNPEGAPPDPGAFWDLARLARRTWLGALHS